MPSAAMIHRSILGERKNTIIPNVYLEWLEGDYVAAVFLKEMVYWSADWSQTHGKDGWFYRTDDEWKQTCWLSRKQITRVITAINKRAGGDMIQKQVRKIRTSGGAMLQETATHYYLDTELYEEVMMFLWSGDVHNDNNRNVPKGQSEDDPKDQPLTYTPDTRTGDVHLGEETPRQKRASQLNDHWVASDRCLNKLTEEGFTSRDINQQINRFRDHHIGKGNTMKDWDRAFMNWMRNAKDWGHLSSKNGHSGDDIPQDGTLFRQLADELRRNGQ